MFEYYVSYCVRLLLRVSNFQRLTDQYNEAVYMYPHTFGLISKGKIRYSRRITS